MAEGVGPALRLEMRGISKRFGGTHALDRVDLSVAAGQVLALVGENGAGKSTLMKILSGAIPADSGEMFLEGRPYRPHDPFEARRAGVGMIYQELSLVPHLSVQENIALGMESATLGILNRTQMRMQAAEALAQLGHSEIRSDAKIRSLTLAEQQIVEIARAIAKGCRVLVLDEPTSSLSSRDVDRLFVLINRLKGQQQAIIYISHFIEELKRIADRFTVLRDGRTAGGGIMEAATSDQIVDLMVGQRFDHLYPAMARTPGEPILEAGELRGETKLQSATFTLRRGEVLGIAGLVGAGRTELLRALFGLDTVRSGNIRMGVYTGPSSPSRRWLQGAGLLSEDRKTEGLALGLSVAENLTLTNLAGVIRPSHRDSIAARWIKRLGIRCRNPRQRVSELSGGNQQKVALARLLHHDVDVLLLDEPTRGIDVASKADLYRLIDESVTHTRPAKAVLVVSSYFPELLGLCDRIAVMCRGRLGPARPVSEWDEHRLILEASGQEAAFS